MAPSSTVVTWCLNPNHIRKSGSIILAFPDSICWGLLWICHPQGIWECRQGTHWLCMCPWLYLSTHTLVFVRTKAGMQHGICHIHNIETKATETHTARWILALSLKSYIPHLTHDSQGTQQKNNVHHFHIIIGYAHSEHSKLCNGVTQKRQDVTTQFTFHRQMIRQTAISAGYVKVSRLHLSAWKWSDFPESWAPPRTETRTLVPDLSGENRWAAQ